MDRFSFLVVACLGATYFLVKRRPFDTFSVSFFGALVYFFPGFLGYAAYVTHGHQIATMIDGGTYRIMLAVLLFLVGGAIVTDIRPKTAKFLDTIEAGAADRYVILFLAALSISALVLTLFNVGISAFSSRKADFNQDLGRAFVVYRNAALLGFIGSVCLRKRNFAILFGCLIGVEVALGFRSFAFMALSSAVWISLLRRGPIRLFSGGARYAVAGLSLILLTLVAKGYLGGLRSGNLSYLRENTLSLDYVLFTLAKSEPFAVVNNLNIGYIYNYSQDLSEFLRSILAASVPFFDVFGFQTASRDFANELFSNVEYGLAFNPWLDLYSAGGWILLLCFLLVYVFTLKLGNRLLTSRRWLTVSATLAAYVGWCAYIERNAIAYQLTGMRRIILVALLCYAVKVLLNKTRRVKR